MAVKKKRKKRNIKKKKRLLSKLILFFFVIGLGLAIFYMGKHYLPKIGDFFVSDREKITEETVVSEVTEPILKAIKYAAEQLGVPNNLTTVTAREEDTLTSIVLDRRRVDLNFANMIITGQVELSGGKLIRGVESASGNIQTINYLDPSTDKLYTVRLSYDRAARYPEIKPKLAIIVDDFGEFAGEKLDRFNQTHPEVTFAILPDLAYTREVMEKSKAVGREVIIHIPMEPLNYPQANPGENAIFVHLSEREIVRRMQSFIRQLPYAKGANNHMGSFVTSDRKTMEIVLNVLKENSLYFVDSRTTASSIAFDLAQQKNINSVKRDIFLDEPDLSEETFKQRVEQLRRFKDNNQNVVVITHCFDNRRLELLNRFIEKAEEIGYEIVRVSRFFDRVLPEIL